MRKGYLLSILLLFVFQTSLLAQQANAIPRTESFEQVNTIVNKYIAENPQEKIHIHFNKPNYVIGDTIWLKAYLLNANNGNRLSSISKIIHLLVVDPKGKEQRIILPVDKGMSAAQIILSDSLYQAGKYLIKAYTQVMRNYNAAYFFNHTIQIGEQNQSNTINYASNNLKSIAANNVNNDTANKNLTINFFPEGGSLINGIRSKVAFKVTDQNGNGISTKGFIIDESGDKVALFETLHKGMGIFALTPKFGAKYFAIIDSGNFKNSTSPLPKTLAEGFSLSINRVDTSNYVIKISKSDGLKDVEEVKMLIQAHGNILNLIQLPITAANQIFTLNKSQLAEGINQITLLSADHIPLAERLIFVDKRSNQLAKVDFDKAHYETRDLVNMSLTVSEANGNGIIGGYSFSVNKIAETMIPEEKQLSIYTNILLNSDLRGKIENPNYYFAATDDKKLNELDVLLLTQGWRRFNTQEILSGKWQKPTYQPELGLKVSGVVTDLKDKPVAGAKVSFVAVKDMLVRDTLADANGRFSFDNLDLQDSVEVILRARGVKESSNVKIILDKDEPYLFVKTDVNDDVDNLVNEINQVASSVTPQTETKIKQGITLKTVEINTKKRIEIPGSIYPFAAAPPDYSFDPEILQETVDLRDLMRNLAGVTIIENKIYGYFQGVRGEMVLILNGSLIEDVTSINPRSLTGVQVVKGGLIAGNMANSLMLSLDNTRKTIYKQSPDFGIVFITMKGVADKFLKVERPTGFLQYKMAGYTYEREFYSPNYELKKDIPKADNRQALFWKPNMITSENGTASLSFYTADETGKYQATLEGVGSNGQIIRKVIYFDVK